MRDLSKNFVSMPKGKRYNMLTIIKEADRIPQPNGINVRSFLCKCDCGNETIVRIGHLRHSKTKSCGCLSGEKHGMRNTRLYKIWRAMHDRCYGKTGIKYYKSRSIKICDEWKNSFIKFKDWALENGYKDHLTIDRNRNYGDYEPSNCRWVTPRLNTLNACGLEVIYHGKKYYFTQLIDDLGKTKHRDAIRSRIKRGYSVDDAIDIPIRKGNYHRVNLPGPN